MARVVKSNRGIDVDFDALRVKQDLASAPKSPDVAQRERFIDKKRRRTAGARKINELVANQSENMRYAKTMIEAGRAAKKLEAEAQPTTEEGQGDEQPIVAQTPAPEAPLDSPKRINRRVR